MSVRSGVVEVLRAELDDRYLVPDQPKLPDDPGGSEVLWFAIVEQASVKPGPAFGLYLVEAHIILTVRDDNPATLEDTLDIGLFELLDMLQSGPAAYGFLSADRDVFQNTHCYDITLTIASTVTKE